MKQLPAKVEHWDDERSIGNSLIVTLKHGWKFDIDPLYPNHVKGFETVAEARRLIREAVPCNCPRCSE